MSRLETSDFGLRNDQSQNCQSRAESAGPGPERFLRLRDELPVLPEVVVEGEGRVDLQALHQRKTRAVREAELLVGKNLEDPSARPDDLRCEVFHAKHPAGSRSFSEVYRDRMASA